MLEEVKQLYRERKNRRSGIQDVSEDLRRIKTHHLHTFCLSILKSLKNSELIFTDQKFFSNASSNLSSNVGRSKKYYTEKVKIDTVDFKMSLRISNE